MIVDKCPTRRQRRRGGNGESREAETVSHCSPLLLFKLPVVALSSVSCLPFPCRSQRAAAAAPNELRAQQDAKHDDIAHDGGELEWQEVRKRCVRRLYTLFPHFVSPRLTTAASQRCSASFTLSACLSSALCPACCTVTFVSCRHHRCMTSLGTVCGMLSPWPGGGGGGARRCSCAQLARAVGAPQQRVAEAAPSSHCRTLPLSSRQAARMNGMRPGGVGRVHSWPPRPCCPAPPSSRSRACSQRCTVERRRSERAGVNAPQAGMDVHKQHRQRRRVEKAIGGLCDVVDARERRGDEAVGNGQRWDDEGRKQQPVHHEATVGGAGLRLASCANRCASLSSRTSGDSTSRAPNTIACS